MHDKQHLNVIFEGKKIKIWYLDDRFGSGDLKNLAGSEAPIGQFEIDNFGELGELDSVKDDKRSIDTGNGSVRDPRLRNVVPGDGLNLVKLTLAN